MTSTLLFDMGGLFFVCRAEPAIEYFRSLGFKDIENYLNRYGQKGFFRDFESGKITEDEFTALVNSHCEGHGCTKEEARYGYCLFVGDVPARNFEYLAELRKKFKVCLVSNTNSFVTNYMNETYGFSDMFDINFCSFEVGVCKPDDEYFRKVLKALGTDPKECLYLDDGPANIEAGLRNGIPGLLVSSDADWYPQLMEHLSK